jgi:dihydrofolate synthase/folylpolyglutamate synthase
MSYTAAIEHLYALGQELAPPPNPGAARRKFDLAHMRVLAHALGDPQDTVPSILIAGTNGKGSTAATLASILASAGYRTGLYTSPHLFRVNERIQLSSPGAHEPLVPISDDDFARLYFRVDDAAQALVSAGDLPHPPSFFEVLTALAFCFFAEQKADIMVLEVGLGGRLDATNIVQPLLSILTDIALDHQDYLGNTIAEIAREKAGILRPHGRLVTLPQHPEANQVIGEVAIALEVVAVDATRYIPPVARHPESGDDHLARNRYAIPIDSGATASLFVDSPLPGQHQQRNLALALAAAVELRNNDGYNISNADLERGIRTVNWPGRLELIRGVASADLLLDVAHNPAGAWTLRAALAQLPSERPRTLIFSCLRDKSLEEMSRILFPLFDSSPGGDPERRGDHIVLAPIGNPRAAAVEDLLAAAHALQVPAHAAPHLAGALAQARAVTPPGGLIVATGSVYLVGEIRQLALEPQ